MPALTPFTFGTKAETLARLCGRLDSAEIPALMHFPVAAWRQDADALLEELVRRFAGVPVAVRSSALIEDSAAASSAGAYLSLLNVESGDRNAVIDAIGRVVDAMTGNPNDQVLIQAMVADVATSGVVMTYDLAFGAPYYVIDYDESGRTDLVTAGNGLNKGLQIYRNADAGLIRSPRIRNLLRLARELERVTGERALDIEFAADRSGRLHLLQARRIALARSWHPITERRVARQLAFVERFVDARSAPRPGVLGQRTMLAVMPDWNPAEMIGTTPRPLAASLYRELITRDVWRTARASMGYRPMPPEELMVVINHHPYIDVRNSFNSFLPDGIDDATGTALVDAWLDRLTAHPEFHDKVEFEVVPTCMDFTFAQDFRSRYGDLLGAAERQHYAARLADLTRRALAPDGTLDRALAASRGLRQRTAAPGSTPPEGALAAAARTLQECREHGTLPFAVAARHAFIAEALLRSAVRRSALAADRLDEFRRSIQTVTSRMVADYLATLAGRQDPARFLADYGHLRPGTYEITSSRYDERNDLFLDTRPPRDEPRPAPFRPDAREVAGIGQLLAESGFDGTTPEFLFDYARKAIAAREEIKFEFTRALSDALSGIVAWGNANGLSRDDLSFLDWSALDQWLVQPEFDDTDRHFLALSDLARRSHEASHGFRLSHVIGGARDVYVATANRSVPNFVGQGKATGHVVCLTPASPATTAVDGLIVCIENADPGFDWIFTRAPAALVTQFGGANSHMAIRCAEFGLPAAIGCGEQIFTRIAAGGLVELNCADRILRPVHGR